MLGRHVGINRNYIYIYVTFLDFAPHDTDVHPKNCLADSDVNGSPEATRTEGELTNPYAFTNKKNLAFGGSFSGGYNTNSVL